MKHPNKLSEGLNKVYGKESLAVKSYVSER